MKQSWFSLDQELCFYLLIVISNKSLREAAGSLPLGARVMITPFSRFFDAGELGSSLNTNISIGFDPYCLISFTQTKLITKAWIQAFVQVDYHEALS
jgi:hypothetical protein